MVILKIVFNYILDKTTLAFLGQPTVGKHILHLSALPTETQRKKPLTILLQAETHYLSL